MTLCVFGASGPVGRAVVGQALARGHGVVAVTRNPDAFGLSAPRLRVVGADILDAAEVEAALDGADAVISAVGAAPGSAPVTTYSAGMANVMAAMRARDLRRVVCVTSKNLAEGGHAGEPLLYRLVFARLLGRIAGTLYDDMRRMEELVRASDLDWTIVRPAGLFAAERVTAYRSTTGHEPGVSTSTADLADALVDEVVGDDQHVGETLEVLTDDGKPPFLLLLARQATLHRR